MSSLYSQPLEHHTVSLGFEDYGDEEKLSFSSSTPASSYSPSRRFTPLSHSSLAIRIKLMINSCIPKLNMKSATIIQPIIQTAIIARSFKEFLSFRACSILTSLLYNKTGVSKVVICLPKNVLENFFKERRAAALSPIIGIALTTFLACKSYSHFAYSSIAKGIIYGIHSTAIMIFTGYPENPQTKEAPSLRINIEREFKITQKDYPSLFNHQYTEITKKAEKTATVFFYVSNIAATILFWNPIVADTISYSLYGLVRIAVIIKLANDHEQKRKGKMIDLTNQS